MANLHLRPQLERLLRVEAAVKPAIYLQLYESTDSVSLNYWLELLLSAGIATFGLVLNSPAVVIGAMLISPLMGPILAMGLALTIGDLYLGLRAVLLVVGSVAAAVALSAGIAWLLPFHAPTTEIIARTQPNLLDLGVALFSGLAGSVLVCRGRGEGGGSALPGVAIAVALMPPLCTMGFGVGSGFSRPIVGGALLLFVTNLAAITATAFFTFFLVRMDAHDVRQRIDEIVHERAKHDRLYIALTHTVVARSLGEIGKLRWRVVMLVAMLALLFIPLRQALLQVRDETVARTAITDAIRDLAPAGTVVSQRIDPSSNPIVMRLVVTTAVSPDQIHKAEVLVARRTGRDVDLSVRKVASDDELTLLRRNLQPPPAPPPPPPFSFDQVRQEALAHLQGPLQEVWPSQSAELLGSEVGFDDEGLVVRLRYQSARPLDATAEQMLTSVFTSRLAVAKLRVVLEYQKPPRARRPAPSRSR